MTNQTSSKPENDRKREALLEERFTLVSVGSIGKQKNIVPAQAKTFAPS